MKKILLKNVSLKKRSGVVLLLTLVILIVLSVASYSLTINVLAQRHRNNYMIDYQRARYGCDSAVKYAVTSLEDINEPNLVGRPNEPDFSDIFHYDQEQYRAFMEKWRQQMILNLLDKKERERLGNIDINDVNALDDINSEDFKRDVLKGISGKGKLSQKKDIGFDSDKNASGDANRTKDAEFEKEETERKTAEDINDLLAKDFNDINSLVVPGPYGPPWPLIKEPAQFEVGDANVTIKIEDENAKYPLGWMLINDDEIKRELEAGFGIFCEWMKIDYNDVSQLATQLDELRAIKPFKVKFEDKKATVRQKVDRGSQRHRSFYKVTTKSITAFEQTADQSMDFSKFINNSLVDVEIFARPYFISDAREESALKYLDIWGSTAVNVNTAPRHVLESAFTFGGDAVEIADAIIKQRRIKPFKDISELKKILFRYSTSIEKCEKYITTASNFFTIRIESVSGKARVLTVIAVVKDAKGVRQVAVLSN